MPSKSPALGPLSRVRFQTFKRLSNAGRRFPLLSLTILESDGSYTVPVPRALAKARPLLCDRSPDSAWEGPLRSLGQ
jgi:hypothetical protein